MMTTEEFGMEELMAQTPEVVPGAIVDGTVVSRSGDLLLVSIPGLKQEAALPMREVETAPPAMGDVLSVVLVRMNGPENRPLVSFRQARERLHWDRIAGHFERKEPVDGRITRRVKGGVSVDVGLDAFMPASQIDERPVARPEEWVGKSVRVFVLEMDRAKGNVLVSRRQFVAHERALRKAKTLETLTVGSVYKGRVTGLAAFGAFVDIGGVEGLLHVTDMRWERVGDPKKVVKPGDEIEVQVLKHDTETQRISLGRKQLLPHPWDGIETRFPPDATVRGKVTSVVPFGAFVQLAPGIEGLIHVSELSWTDRVTNPKAVLKAGQEVECRVIDLDRAKEKLSLSLKRAGENPWDEAARLYPVGTRLEGEVVRLAPFGAFVRISSGLEGLLRPQDYSWAERIDSFSGVLSVGQKINVVVLEIDPAKEKMAFGVRQLEKDPLSLMKIGQAVEGTVARVAEFGLFVRLPNGLEGLVRNVELHARRAPFGDAPSGPEKDTPAYKEGDPISAAVLKISRKERKLELSVRRYERAQEKELLRRYSGQGERVTLGKATGWDEDSLSF